MIYKTVALDRVHIPIHEAAASRLSYPCKAPTGR